MFSSFCCADFLPGAELLSFFTFCKFSVPSEEFVENKQLNHERTILSFLFGKPLRSYFIMGTSRCLIMLYHGYI